MTERRDVAWVGDQVRDLRAGKEGIVTDVQNGTYVLRPLHTWWTTWTVPSADDLEIVLTREERLRRRPGGWL